MNSWINLSAVGVILGLGLVFGAGLPALFAIGLRALSPSAARGTPPSKLASAGPRRAVAGSTRIAAAVVCFAVVLAAIGWGIYLIVAQS